MPPFSRPIRHAGKTVGLFFPQPTGGDMTEVDVALLDIYRDLSHWAISFYGELKILTYTWIQSTQNITRKINENTIIPDGHEVDVAGLHVYGDLAHGLGGVRVEEHLVPPAYRSDLAVGCIAKKYYKIISY